MIYIAGSLFTESEIKQRKTEAEMIRKRLQEEGIHDDVFNPIENPFNDKKLKPKAIDIFQGDFDAMCQASHLLFNLDNPMDAGVFMELGQMIGKGKKIYPVLSDIRMKTAGEYEGKYVPFGINQYVIGALDYYDITLYTSSEEAINAMIDDLLNKK